MDRSHLPQPDDGHGRTPDTPGTPDTRGNPDDTGPASLIPGAGQSALISFTNPDDFLAELRDRGPNVDGVLRLTFRWHPDAALPVTDLWVVANYLLRLDPATLAVVRLDHYIGAVWQDIDDRASQLNRERANQLKTRIDEEARALGIEVRAGTLTRPPREHQS
ncbi:MAG TPA: hypothetical protein VFN74_22310 [Chloroflexota bacterium]|nr:hypothetical protein [Chloroflexota bacterium]